MLKSTIKFYLECVQDELSEVDTTLSQFGSTRLIYNTSL